MIETTGNGRKVPDTDALREQIKRNTDRHQFLGAGAGAGKTTMLVDHYFHLLQAGLRPAQLVAVTFTEKAAAEMKQRLRAECRARARQVRELGEPSTVDWEAVVHDLEAAPISTIHGFCARLLRENALVAGLDPQFTVLDETEADMLLEETVRRQLLSRLGHEQTADVLAVAMGYSELVKCLGALVNDRVKIEGVLADEAYQSAETLLQKWTQMRQTRQADLLPQILGHEQFACNLRYMMETEGPEDDRLENRRQELCEIIEEYGLADCTAETLAPEQYDRVTAGLMKMREVKGGSAGAAKAWAEAGLSKDDMVAAQRVFMHDEGMVAQFDDELKQVACDPRVEQSSAELTSALVAEVKAAVAAYADAKQQRAALDFEDLLELTRRLWEQHPEALKRTRRDIRHLLIDEFQDTNTLQKQVLWPLATGKSHDPDSPDDLSGAEGRLFVVGDAKQSIYRFRGADVTVFNTTRHEMAQPACLDHDLKRNFRSSSSLVEVFNALFSDPAVMGTDSREPWEASYTPMETDLPRLPDGQAPLEIHLITAGEQADDEAARHDGTSMQALRKQEAEWLAGRLVNMMNSGDIRVRHKDGEQESWGPVQPGDVAILLRSMTDVRIYEQALLCAELPYYLVVGRGFFDAREVQDVANFLKALENGLDDVALVGALRSPLIGLSDETLFHLSRLGPGPWWWRLRRAAGDKVEQAEHEVVQAIAGCQLERIRRAAALFEELRRKKNRVPLAALVQEIVDRTGYSATLARLPNFRQFVSNVRKLVELAGQFQAQKQTHGGAGLRDFIEHIKRLTTREVHESQAPVEEESGDSIKLITYHSAKGLQWPVVIVPDLCRKPGGGFGAPYRFHPDGGLAVKTTRLRADMKEDGEWPAVAGLIKDLDDREEEAENRRLFYVAATRARDLLILSGVTTLNSDGGLPKAASDSPLGWINKALGDCFWKDAEHGPGETLWKWREGTLVAGDGLETSDEDYRPPAAPEVRQPHEVLPLIEKQIGQIPEAAMGQTRFTATELSLYHHCPRLYELRHRVGLPGAPPAFSGMSGPASLSAMDLGTVAHRVLQLVGSGGRDELDRLVPTDGTVLPLGTGLDKRAAAQAASIHSHVRHFIDSELYRQLFRTGSDLRSEVGLSALLTVGDQRQVMIEGKVDALVRTADGRLHLLDYKTGRPEEGMHGQYLVQLGLYCHAVEQATGQCPSTACLVYLADTGCDVKEQNIGQIKQQALDAAEQAICGIWHGKLAPRAEDCGYCRLENYCKPRAESDETMAQAE